MTNIPFPFIELANICNKSTYVCLQNINGCVCSKHIWSGFKKKKFHLCPLIHLQFQKKGSVGSYFLWSTELGNCYVPELQEAPRCFTYFYFYPSFIFQVIDT